jgi:hypothetical protein
MNLAALAAADKRAAAAEVGLNTSYTSHHNVPDAVHSLLPQPPPSQSVNMQEAERTRCLLRLLRLMIQYTCEVVLNPKSQIIKM